MTVWDNRQLCARDQFDYWRETICRAFVPLTPDAGELDRGFASRVEARGLGLINRTVIDSQAQRVDHGHAEIARTGDHCYFVNLQLAGTCYTRQRHAESLVRPGQFAVVDSALPYHFEFSGRWRMMSYRIPHHLLDARAVAPDLGLGVAVDAKGGTGQVVASLMRSLWELGAAPGMSPHAVSQLEQAFAAASAAALTGVSDDAEGHAEALRTAVDRYVRDNLGDPNLSVASVAARFGISPRSLHNLYAQVAGEEGTFATMVRRLRLRRAAEMLRDPSVTLAVADIAVRVGMRDPASFSRAFRREFGAAPREMRAAG